MERAARLIGKLKLCATPEELARAAWPVAVGKRIAAHASAAALDGRRLIVEVEDAVWQRNLKTLEPQIVRRMEEVLGSALVGTLSFRPMLARRMPQREERSARPADEAEAIPDVAMRHIYKVARRKATA
jgi:predicted nucleic acid-binding Zn ribbon protein